jgi:quaternary ammonium compound-resistance protein SugE
MAWVYLLIAGILEIVWAIGLKYTDGWTKLVPSLVTGSAMIVGFYFLSMALKSLPIGTAYAIWTGIGAVGTAILGMFLFSESSDWKRLVCIGLIVFGIVGLKFFLTETQH